MDDKKEAMSRRNFLGLATWGIGGFIGVSMGIPAVIYTVGESLEEGGAGEWVRLGSASKVELGIPTLFKVKIVRQTGWIVNETEVSVYILTENGREYVAMSNICTHLGCRVRWIGDQDIFYCPCHNASFKKNGDVNDGPPPKPLERFEVKVEDDQIYIKGV